MSSAQVCELKIRICDSFGTTVIDPVFLYFHLTPFISFKILTLLQLLAPSVLCP